MGQIIESIAIISIATVCVYGLYLIYLRSSNNIKTIDLIPEDKIEEYKKIRNKHMMVFIFGILIGFVIILIRDNNTPSIEKPTNIKNTHINISDVDDIHVL
jgi:hypothetical protein